MDIEIEDNNGDRLMKTIADIPRYTARITVESRVFGSFTQDVPLAPRDCLDAPKAAAKVASKNLAKCILGKVVSVELIAS